MKVTLLKIFKNRLTVFADKFFIIIYFSTPRWRNCSQSLSVSPITCKIWITFINRRKNLRISVACSTPIVGERRVTGKRPLSGIRLFINWRYSRNSRNSLPYPLLTAFHRLSDYHRSVYKLKNVENSLPLTAIYRLSSPFIAFYRFSSLFGFHL